MVDSGYVAVFVLCFNFREVIEIIILRRFYYYVGKEDEMLLMDSNYEKFFRVSKEIVVKMYL